MAVLYFVFAKFNRKIVMRRDKIVRKTNVFAKQPLGLPGRPARATRPNGRALVNNYHDDALDVIVSPRNLLRARRRNRAFCRNGQRQQIVVSIAIQTVTVLGDSHEPSYNNRLVVNR